MTAQYDKQWKYKYFSLFSTAQIVSYHIFQTFFLFLSKIISQLITSGLFIFLYVFSFPPVFSSSNIGRKTNLPRAQTVFPAFIRPLIKTRSLVRFFKKHVTLALIRRDDKCAKVALSNRISFNVCPMFIDKNRGRFELTGAFIKVIYPVERAEEIWK